VGRGGAPWQPVHETQTWEEDVYTSSWQNCRLEKLEILELNQSFWSIWCRCTTYCSTPVGHNTSGIISIWGPSPPRILQIDSMLRNGCRHFSQGRNPNFITALIGWWAPNQSRIFSFFLSWVASTQLNHWTKWEVTGARPINLVGPKKLSQALPTNFMADPQWVTAVHDVCGLACILGLTGSTIKFP